MKHLETDSVQLSYDGRMILNNVYLSCRTGEVIGLIGRNGSGKSSLLKVMFGTRNCDNRSVRIDGMYYSHPYRQHAGLRYLPQDGFLPSYVRLREIPALFNWQTDAFKLFDEFKGLENQRLGTLSGGQKKLTEVLAILYSDADFILLDEPFSFLSPVAIERLVDIIRQRARETGIILTDHMYRTVLEACDRLYLVQTGVLKEINDPQQLVDIGYLKELPG